MTQLSSADAYTPAVQVQGFRGWDVLVSGTFTGTISIQLSKDNATWHTIDTSDAPVIKTGTPASMWFVRAGFATGDYTSGTAEVEVYGG